MNAILKPFTPLSWFHPTGIYRAQQRLEPLLPDVSGSLFLTLTIDPSRIANMSEAFASARDRVRRVFYLLRRGVDWDGEWKQIDAPYCVKVEFHVSGAAHFHVILLTRRYVPNDLVAHLWGLGFTKVRRINAHKFRYLLKYVTKGGGLPDWVLGRSRLRVFQSSRHFLRKSADAETPATPVREGAGRRRKPSVSNIGERIERWKRTATLQQGEHFQRVMLAAPWRDLFDQLVYPLALAGRYLGFGKFAINEIQHLEPWINPHLIPQLSAVRLRDRADFTCKVA